MWYKASRFTNEKSFARNGRGGTIQVASAGAAAASASSTAPAASRNLRKDGWMRRVGWGPAAGIARELRKRDDPPAPDPAGRAEGRVDYRGRPRGASMTVRQPIGTSR